MNAFSFSGLLVIISSLFFGFFVFFRNPGNKVNRLWVIFSTAVALWGLAAFKIGMIPLGEEKSAVMWWRITYPGITFIPVLFYHFVHAWLELKKKIFLVLFYLWGFIFSGIQWLPKWDLFISVNTLKPVFSSFYVLKPTLLLNLFVFCWFSIIIYSHYELYKAFRTSVGLRKNQIRYFFLAIALAFLGGGLSFSMCYGLDIYPYFNFAVPLYPAIMAYAILRYRLMDIRIVFTRAGIFLAVYAVVLGIPFIMLKYTGSGLLSTSFAVVFATIGPLIYRFLQVKAESVILAQQHRYQKILLQTAIGMVTEHNLKKLSKLIVYILKRTIRISFAAIFIKDKKSGSYDLKAIRGESDTGKCVASFRSDAPFVTYLKKKMESSFPEETPKEIITSADIISRAKAIIPISIGNELIGFVFLGEKMNNQPYSDEDINVFRILSRQAALAVENCIFFEESKEMQQRMFSAEKLASIGGMADGIAHQIKNRLNLFSLAAGELKLEIKDFATKHTGLLNNSPELHETFKYLDGISSSIIDNVKRTDGIIKGILDFAKVENKENLFCSFSFREIVELASRLLMLKHEAASLPITLTIEGYENIYAFKAQLTEVIYNLLDNAYEAIQERKTHGTTRESGTFVPEIKVALTHTRELHIIKVSDNGIGIKGEDTHKVFAPFFTTKTSYKSGSGIGVYVVKRIIEEIHKGSIRFDSSYMRGTSFTIELPRPDVR